MFEFVKCNLCGRQDYKVLYKSNLDNGNFDNRNYYVCTNTHLGKHGQIVRCKNCGLAYANPRFSSGDMRLRYQGVIDETYLNEKSARISTFINSLREIEKRKAKGIILDVGCYAGFFLELAEKRGWEAYGLEPSIWASGYAREKLGLKVKTGTIEEAGFSDNYFDVITFWDTLEHLADPKSALQKAHNLLKSYGLLCISTIDIDSLFARLLGKRWPQLMQMHTYYFSSKTLKKFLTDCGFSIVDAHKHKRILRLDYLISRFESYSWVISMLLFWIAKNLRVGEMPVSVKSGDLITVYAVKR